MSIIRFFLPFAIALSTSFAAPSVSEQSPREIAIDNLLSERGSAQSFETVVRDARKNGISDQAILEATFLYHVDRREDAAIAAMLPEFLKRRDDFKTTDSVVFAMKDDWLAVIEYVQAIDSLAKNDKDAFKKHITEAFWLSPRQASAFAPHVERLRLEEAMRSLKIDFTLKLAPVNAETPESLESLISGKKALLLHFWAPASRECEASIPDFVTTAIPLIEKGISVVSLIPDGSPKTLTDARNILRPLGEKPPGAWLIDSDKNSLGTELLIHDLPTMVLVSTEGKILFNGDPSDDAFWNALKKINAEIVRPQAVPGNEE